jgi:hypothetical protein
MLLRHNFKIQTLQTELISYFYQTKRELQHEHKAAQSFSSTQLRQATS